jgi:hypothetical protein
MGGSPHCRGPGSGRSLSFEPFVFPPAKQLFVVLLTPSFWPALGPAARLEFIDRSHASDISAVTVGLHYGS